MKPIDGPRPVVPSTSTSIVPFVKLRPFRTASGRVGSLGISIAGTPRCSTTLTPSLSVQRSGVNGMTAASAVPAATTGAASATDAAWRGTGRRTAGRCWPWAAAVASDRTAADRDGFEPASGLRTGRSSRPPDLRQRSTCRRVSAGSDRAGPRASRADFRVRSRTSSRRSRRSSIRSRTCLRRSRRSSRRSRASSARSRTRCPRTRSAANAGVDRIGSDANRAIATNRRTKRLGRVMVGLLGARQRHR